MLIRKDKYYTYYSKLYLCGFTISMDTRRSFSTPCHCHWLTMSGCVQLVEKTENKPQHVTSNNFTVAMWL